MLERRGLKVWTEMFSDGVLVLEQAGALDRGTPVRTSFVFGSQELYDWVDDNPRVRMLRTETTNSPAAIAQQPAMTSINTALQVDLFDQANASRIGTRIYSGFGGQTDFTVGASHSPGGRAFMALRSWHPRADVSTIVPLVDEPVTSFQHGAVVTEQGIAWMWGRERARAGAQPDRARRAPAASATTSGRRHAGSAWPDPASRSPARPASGDEHAEDVPLRAGVGPQRLVRVVGAVQAQLAAELQHQVVDGVQRGPRRDRGVEVRHRRVPGLGPAARRQLLDLLHRQGRAGRPGG